MAEKKRSLFLIWMYKGFDLFYNWEHGNEVCASEYLNEYGNAIKKWLES